MSVPDVHTYGCTLYPVRCNTARLYVRVLLALLSVLGAGCHFILRGIYHANRIAGNNLPVNFLQQTSQSRQNRYSHTYTARSTCFSHNLRHKSNTRVIPSGVGGGLSPTQPSQCIPGISEVQGLGIPGPKKQYSSMLHVYKGASLVGCMRCQVL